MELRHLNFDASITTKFLPVEDLIRSQLFTNFDGYSLKNDAVTPLTISNFSRARQAYFLSYTLQILCENTTFIDVQMMCNDDFDISIGFRFEKIHVSCTIHFYSLYLDYQIVSALCVPSSGQTLAAKIQNQDEYQQIWYPNLG